MNDRTVFRLEKDGTRTILADRYEGKRFNGPNDLVVKSNGSVYFTDTVWGLRGADKDPAREIPYSGTFLVKNGTATLLLSDKDTPGAFGNGITLSPDQTLLYVADYRSHWIYSYRVQPDGTLTFRQRYYWLHAPDTADDSGADGIRVDSDGRLYVATRLGIQVCDQAGRVNCIIQTPNGRVSNVSFGGANFDTLFATCGDKVYKRKLKVKGANAWAAPLKPAPPRL